MTAKYAQFPNEITAIFFTQICHIKTKAENHLCNNKTVVNACGMPPLTPHNRDRSIIEYMNTTIYDYTI